MIHDADDGGVDVQLVHKLKGGTLYQHGIEKMEIHKRPSWGDPYVDDTSRGGYPAFAE